MKVTVDKLKNIKLAQAAIALSKNLNPADYGYDELKFLGPVGFDGTIVNVGELLDVRGVFYGSLELICNRCLKPFAWDFKIELNEVYTNKPEAAAGDAEEELNYFAGDVVDLTPQILRQVFMEIPMKVLCSKNCKGLCSTCGKDLNLGQCSCDQQNIDIRLEKLKDILTKMDKEV